METALKFTGQKLENSKKIFEFVKKFEKLKKNETQTFILFVKFYDFHSEKKSEFQLCHNMLQANLDITQFNRNPFI